MKKIGITGGIGSGKTTVCNIFRILGIPVFDSDLEARNIINSDLKVKNELMACFGRDIYSENGLHREKMAAIIFNNKAALKKMNSIVHPAVRSYFSEWCIKNNNKPYVLQEAAILFESGGYKQMDKIITIYAPVEERIKRVVERSNTSFDEVSRRIKNQLSDEEKIKKSDFVINNYSSNLVIPQVLNIHKQLLELF